MESQGRGLQATILEAASMERTSPPGDRTGVFSMSGEGDAAVRFCTRTPCGPLLAAVKSYEDYGLFLIPSGIMKQSHRP